MLIINVHFDFLSVLFDFVQFCLYKHYSEKIIVINLIKFTRTHEEYTIYYTIY